MANYHSIIRNWGEPESTFDTELAMGALEHKQGKYDANSAKIQEAISNYGNIGLLRDKEKQKLYGNLSQMMENIEGASGLDLSSNRVTGMIMSDISKTIDEDLVKHYSLFKNRASFDETVSKKQAEGKGKYNENNVRHAEYRSGYDAYMRGETENFTPLQYADYADLGEASLRTQKAVKEYINTFKKKEIRGENFYYTTESKELTRQRIKDVAQATMTQEEKQQLAINGWAAYQGAEPGKLEEDYSLYVDREIEEINFIIKTQKGERGITDSKSKKEEYTQSIEAFEEHRDKIKEDSQKIMGMEGNMGKDHMTTTLGENRYLNEISKAFSIDRNQLLTKEITVISSALYKDMHDLEEKKKDPKRDLLSTTVPKKDIGDRNPHKELVQRVSDTKSIFEQTSITTFNELSREHQDWVRSEVDESLRGREVTQGERDEMTASKMLSLSKDGLNLLTPTQARRLGLAQEAYKIEVGEHDRTREEVLEEIYDEEYGELFREDIDRSNLEVVIGGKVQNINEVFAERGILTKEDLLRDTPERDNKDLRAAISAEIELTNRTPATEEVNTLKKVARGIWAGAASVAPFEFAKYMGALKAEGFQEEAQKIEDIASIYENEGGLSKTEAEKKALETIGLGAEGVSKHKDNTTTETAGQKAWDAASNVLLGGAAGFLGIDRAGINRYDIGKAKRGRSGNSYERQFNDKLNARQPAESRQQAIVVPETSPLNAPLIALIESPSVGENVVRNKAGITLVEAGNDYFEASYTDKVKNGVDTFKAMILKRDIENIPGFKEAIDSNREGHIFNADNFPEEGGSTVTYSTSIPKIKGMANLFSQPDAVGDKFIEDSINPEKVREELIEITKRSVSRINKRGEDLEEENLYERTKTLVGQITSEGVRPLKVGVNKYRDPERGTSIHTKVYFEENDKEYVVFEDSNGQAEDKLTEYWTRLNYYPQSLAGPFLNRLAEGRIDIEEFKRLEAYYNTQNQ